MKIHFVASSLMERSKKIPVALLRRMKEPSPNNFNIAKVHKVGGDDDAATANDCITEINQIMANHGSIQNLIFHGPGITNHISELHAHYPAAVIYVFKSSQPLDENNVTVYSTLKGIDPATTRARFDNYAASLDNFVNHRGLSWNPVARPIFNQGVAPNLLSVGSTEEAKVVMVSINV